MAKQTYVTTRDGFVLGVYHKKGDELLLTDGQAQYEAMAGKIKKKAVAKKTVKPTADKGR